MFLFAKTKMNFNKLLLLSYNENPIEGFVIEHVFIVAPILLGLIIIFFTNKYFFNFEAICPNCASKTDLSRIKKNKFFNRFSFTEKIRKYNCRKCHYKFYILKNAPKAKSVESDKF